MGENNRKWSNWQRINLKNIKAAYAAQYHKNKPTNQKMGQRTDISPKKIYRWLTNTWKDAQHHSLSEKCKPKSQWATMSCQSEWLLSKSLQTINAGGCGEKEILLRCWWECKLVQPLWRTVWSFLKKLEIELLYNPERWCCESAALNMPANLENSAVATALEKVSFHSNSKEWQWQRMLKLPHICTHLTRW